MSLPPQYSASQVAQAFQVGERHVRFLGRGSFGETWMVQAPHGKVACKIIDQSRVSSDRLGREIEGLRRTQHSAVVQLLDHSDIIINGRREHLLVFEYVPGGDMGQAIHSGSKPSRLEARQLLRRLLEGVAALHAVDVVHRDIKPGNIALRDSQWTDPVILDLGLAKPLDVSTLTAYPQRVGTLLYMAPEQLRGERAGKPADLWSVAVSFVEAVTGNTPFSTEADDHLSEEEFVRRLLERQKEQGYSLPPYLDEDVAVATRRLLSFKSYRRSRVERILVDLKSGD
jgi:eukaryotic-like serine/threonine-protein kinase